MLTHILCDFDDTLAPSERVAFPATWALVTRELAKRGLGQELSVHAFMTRFVGCSVARIITEVVAEFGLAISDEELDGVIAEEDDVVIGRLSTELEPAPGANDTLTLLEKQYTLAIVSSSGLTRLRACLRKTGQDRFFGDRIFSARDLFGCARSKPHPDIYLYALERLETQGENCIAIEDSRSGVTAAAAAGIPVIGYVGCVAKTDQQERIEALLECGAFASLTSWRELAIVLAERSIKGDAASDKRRPMHDDLAMEKEKIERQSDIPIRLAHTGGPPRT